MIEHLLTAEACDVGRLYSHPMIEAVLGGSLHPGGTELTLSMAARAGIGPDDHVLDVGCGKGTSAITLAKQTGCQVTGVDVSATSVAEAEARAQAQDVADRTRFHGIADLSDLDGPFDALLSECTLCLQGGTEAALEQYQRLLRPGGRLLLSDVTVEEPAEAFRSAAGFMACLGGALPREELVERVGSRFRIDHLEHRIDLVAEVRDRIRSRIQVEAVLDAAGPRAQGLRDLVETAEAALEAGHLGYAAMVATRA